MSPDIAASIHARLLRPARERGEQFELTLARYAAERFLYRLGNSGARDRCILKGASLLSVWFKDPYRATRDIDVLASGPVDEQAIRALVDEVCGVPCPEDGLRFDLANLAVEDIRGDEKYVGKRARFRAFLGKARIRVQIDFGVGDAVAIPSETIVYPTLLPALPAPSLRAYPREVALAEKFHAMVNLGTHNSRMKDFHDVWALTEAFAFEGHRLRTAIDGCFERRGTRWTDEVPGALTSAFYLNGEIALRWRPYLAAGAVLIPPPAQFEIVGERVAQFLGPVRDSLVAVEPFERSWPAGGPWR
jgi:predicted nucleotidyltransferase component of viral defense system